MAYMITPIDQSATQAVAVDDMLLVKGVPATAGSKMLEAFVPLFDAEAVTRIKTAGYSIAGKTNVGEFGLDLLGETSAFGAVTDSRGNLRGAAGELVADGKVFAALSVDLNGTPRRAAALAGVAFLKPTYGTVSRYGVIPCACSGEQIGVTARTTADVAAIMAVIAGHDPKDGTSLPTPSYEYPLKGAVAGLRFCVPTDYLQAASPEAVALVDSAAKALEKGGAVVEQISFPIARDAQRAWQILLAAETCNNLSRYDGVKFGHRSEKAEDINALYINSRTEGLGSLAKAMILYGSDVLSQGRYEICYDKGLRIRRLVRQALDTLFSEFDGILLPPWGNAPYPVPKSTPSLKPVYDESFFTAIPNLTGVPAIAVAGVQLIADSLKDSLLLTVGDYLEKEGASK